MTRNPRTLENVAIAPFAVDLWVHDRAMAKMGAYTELWAGLSENLGLGGGGKDVLPWGRLHRIPRPEFGAALTT